MTRWRVGAKASTAGRRIATGERASSARGGGRDPRGPHAGTGRGLHAGPVVAPVADRRRRHADVPEQDFQRARHPSGPHPGTGPLDTPPRWQRVLRHAHRDQPGLASVAGTIASYTQGARWHQAMREYTWANARPAAVAGQPVPRQRRRLPANGRRLSARPA